MRDGKDRHVREGEDAPFFSIEFLNGPREGEVVPLAGERITIGRRSDNTIVIADQNVSSVHGEIIFEGGMPVIRDLGSTNGVFVDERKVEEVLLSEGDEVRLGQTRFAVRKAGTPGGPAFAAGGAEEPGVGGPPAAAGDLEGVRVIREVRTARRGMGSLVLLVLMLLALAAAAYYYFFEVKEVAGVPGTLEAARGNLAAEGWSFEGSPGKGASLDVWDLEGGGSSHFLRSAENPRSGSRSLKAVLSSGGYAAALRTSPIPVGAGGYKAGLWAAIQGDLVVGLKVFFRETAGEGEGRAVPSPALGGVRSAAFGRNDDGAYHRIEGVIVPPPGAEEMYVEIVAAGRGTAYVDDLEIAADPGAAPRASFSSGQMKVLSSGGGFEVFRNDRFLMRGGRLVVTRAGDSGGTESFGAAAAAFGGGKGFQYAGPGAPLLGVEHSLAAGDPDLTATVKITGAEGAGCRDVLYCFDLAPSFAEEGVGVMTGDEFVTFSEAFPPMEARALVFGGQHDRVMVDLGGGRRVSGGAAGGAGLTFSVHLAPLPVVEARWRIRCDFSEDAKKATALVNEAARAERQREFGKALDLIRKIETSYSFMEPVLNRAAPIKARILAEKKKLLVRIRDRLKSAAFLENPELFDELEAFCDDCLSLFPGDKDFTGARGNVLEESRKLKEAMDGEKARRYYDIARCLKEAGGRGGTLSLIVDYMEKRFAGTEWAKKALDLVRREDGQDRNRD